MKNVRWLSAVGVATAAGRIAVMGTAFGMARRGKEARLLLAGLNHTTKLGIN
jgi:hypothetical protein